MAEKKRTSKQTIENQTFNAPIALKGERATPSLGMYQAVYPLSEADYMKLDGASGPLLTLGFGVLGYAGKDSYAIASRLVRGEQRVSDLGREAILPGIALATGMVLLVWARFLGSSRRALRKRIEEHFDRNPGSLEVRS